MRRLTRRATPNLLIAVSCLLGACSSHSPSMDSSTGTAGAPGSTVGCRPSDGDVYAAGMEKLGAAGQFDFTLVSSKPAPPAQGDNWFVVQVSDAAGNPTIGKLSVTLDMPQHGHQGNPPEISFDPESDAFQLEPMDLFMVGLWRITFSFEGLLDGVSRTDSAVFAFCID